MRGKIDSCVDRPQIAHIDLEERLLRYQWSVKTLVNLNKYILLLIKDEMITLENDQGFKYSLTVSLGEEA